MRIGRAIIIPAIIALGVAGSTVASSAMVGAAGSLHPYKASTQAQPTTTVIPGIYFHA